MNILVKTFGGPVIVRPDTTWKRDDEDFYIPDFVTVLSFTPVLYARISRPGRMVQKKFASRYIDKAGFGVLSYPESFIDGSEAGFAKASCLDRSSFLPHNLFDPREIFSRNGVFTLSLNGEKKYESEALSIELIESAIEEATRCIYIRTGDLIAVELGPRVPQGLPKNAASVILGEWSGKTVIDFKIFS